MLPPPDPTGTCLVTGASSGIGVALAEQLAGRGYNLVIVARRADRLDDLAERLRSAHRVLVEAAPCDLSDAAQREKLLASVAASGRRVDILINNAGYGMSGRWLDLDPDVEREMIGVVVSAPLHLCRALIPDMVRRGSGAVLNMGSIASFQPMPQMAAYGAAKAFSLSLTNALHVELAGTGVTVTACCPGPVRTEFTAVAGGEEVAAGIPGFAWKEPEDVAAAALRGLARGRRLVTPGWVTSTSSIAGRLAPQGPLLRLINRLWQAD
jgi:uncharacterized protein